MRLVNDVLSFFFSMFIKNIQAINLTQIGNNVRLGPNVGLISANHDPDDYDNWIKTKPILIGDNVWIGMGVVIMPGVTIGDNVIIAANAVVNTDIPDNSIAGGIPCKVIKQKEQYKGFDYSSLK
jgi:acetyltransferase-like isoleucine patch superfamily enzyme